MKIDRTVGRAALSLGAMLLLTLLLATVAGVLAPRRAHAAPFRSVTARGVAQQEEPKHEDPNAIGWQVWRTLDPDVRAKINPRLLAEFRGEVTPTHLGGGDMASLPPLPRAQTRYLVYLREQPDLRVLESQVFASAADQRTAVVDLLRTSTSASQAPVRALLDERVNADVVAGYQPFYIANVIAVEGNLLTVIELAQRDDVAYIDANYALVPLWEPATGPAATVSGSAAPAAAAQSAPDALSPRNWNIDLVDADRVWQELGIRGAGAVVAGFDSGVTLEHPALRDAYRGLLVDGEYDHNYNWFEPDGRLYPNGNLGPSLSDAPYDCDYWGTHGTHTMGTMVGASTSATGSAVGMAPGARWIAVPGICDNTMPGGIGDDIGGLKAFQWLLCPTDLTGELATADCAKAPDVINNSWGSANPVNNVFRPAIQALRAAGIAPVFASGNPYAGEGSIGSPASAPEAITVGATDSSDEVTYFSGQGPSFYPGEQKPELSAPGQYVLSSVGGGWIDYTEGSGTSMAAPHVAGLIALLVSADLTDGVRDFDVDELERFMTYTAVDLGEPGPDGEYGYGRINAFAAVSWALSAGDLTGRVSATGTGAPVAAATITGVKGGSNDRFEAVTAAGGVYSTTVPGGVYNVEVTAWGHAPASFSSQRVLAGAQSVIDFRLDALPTAPVSGTVSGPNGPVGGATVTVAGAPAGVTATSAADGSFALTLPEGDHELIVTADGFRRRTQTVTVAAGGATPAIAMTPGPRILLVDAEARFGWFYGWPVYAFFGQALDERGYTYDLWPIQYTRFEDTDTLEDGSIGYGTPSLATLQTYDVVIWTHGGCYEAYYGCVRAMGDTAYDALLGYLDGGGKLIISGQDFAQGEDGGALLDDYVRADFVTGMGAAEGGAVEGTAFLDGLDLTITNAALYGHPNGLYYLSPDVVQPQTTPGADSTAPEQANTGLSYPILTYADSGGAAALASISCTADYRTVYFALGLENVGPRAGVGGPEFDEVLDRSLTWLQSPRPAHAVQSSLDATWSQVSVQRQGVYTLMLANEGTETAAVELEFAGNVWSTVARIDGVIVSSPILIPPCGEVAIEIVVTPPQTAINGTTDRVELTLRGLGDGDRTYTIETLVHADWQYEARIPREQWEPMFAAQADDIYVYTLGGYGPTSDYMGYGVLSTVSRFNGCTRTWEEAPSMPVAMTGGAATALDGKIYVIGGAVANESPWGYDITMPTDTVLVYDPDAGTWSYLAPLPQPISGGAAAGIDGKIYFFGGNTWSRYLDSVLIYDVATNSWSSGPTIPTGTRAYADAATLDGRIYLTGSEYDVQEDVDIFDPATGVWSKTAPMQNKRYDMTIAATASGYLYAIGGYDYNTYGLLPAERYDPRTDEWLPVSVPRESYYAASAVYADGRIYYVSENLQSLAVDSSFCMSNATVSSAYALPGATITYTLNIFPSIRAIPAVGIEQMLPDELSFVDFIGTPDGAIYDDASRSVRWTGALAANDAARQVQYTAKFGRLLDFAWQTGDQFSSETHFSALDFPRPGQDVGYVQTQNFTVLLPDFTPSSKQASALQALSGVPITYTIDVRSTNVAGDAVRITDTLPANMTLVPGTLSASTGQAAYDEATHTISWDGEIVSPSSTYVRARGKFTWGDSDGQGDIPDVAYGWEDITGTGSYAGSGDDYVICDLPVDFAFPFYGERYDRFCVSTNGWLSFGGATSSGLSNVCPITAPTSGTPRIAAAWDDLVVYGGIYYQTLGSAPDRRLVVTWQDVVPFASYAYETSTFQLVLHENGDVDFNVRYAGEITGYSSTTGIEGTGDIPGVTYACNASATLHDQMTVHYAAPGLGGDPAFATVRFQAVAPEMAINTPVTNAVRIDTSLDSYTRTVTTLFNSLSLQESTLTPSVRELEPATRVVFSAVLRNTGLKTADNATLRGRLPDVFAADAGSVTCSVGTCTLDGNQLTWRGPVAHDAPTRVEFAATLA
ncbi:MAG: S8 family serine peptidase, partial [Caldilineaceae bacterium]|nr:S8 family serine peptidase [Caldilineaceae bacterium]